MQRLLALGVLAVALGVLATPAGAQTLFSDSFETGDGHTVCNLITDANGWNMSGGAVTPPVVAAWASGLTGQVADGTQITYPGSGGNFSNYLNDAGLSGGLSSGQKVILSFKWLVNPGWLLGSRGDEMDLYREPQDAGNSYRKTMLEEVRRLLDKEYKKADHHRDRYFAPDFSSIDSYERSLSKYRDDLIRMLGWPLDSGLDRDVPLISSQEVAKDSLGRISRILVETLPGVNTYGIFFRPHGDGPFPLVISQHGGGGTPELCSGFFHSANYNDITRRVLRRGCAVFAPQLLLWQPDRFGPDHEKDRIDGRLKEIGGSLAALELYRIVRSLDYFVTHEDIDPKRIGMIGLSYGGFYTLFAAAIDKRISVAASSGFFNYRKVNARTDLGWFNSANHFMDYEVGALICPRPLYIEVGKNDELGRHAQPEARNLETTYRQLGIMERYSYKEHDGGHEINKADDGINFLCRYLTPE